METKFDEMKTRSDRDRIRPESGIERNRADSRRIRPKSRFRAARKRAVASHGMRRIRGSSIGYPGIRTFCKGSVAFCPFGFEACKIDSQQPNGSRN